MGVHTDLYNTRTTSAAVADETKYAYPRGKDAPSCMVKKTQFHAKCACLTLLVRLVNVVYGLLGRLRRKGNFPVMVTV